MNEYNPQNEVQKLASKVYWELVDLSQTEAFQRLMSTDLSRLAVEMMLDAFAGGEGKKVEEKLHLNAMGDALNTAEISFDDSNGTYWYPDIVERAKRIFDDAKKLNELSGEPRIESVALLPREAVMQAEAPKTEEVKEQPKVVEEVEEQPKAVEEVKEQPKVVEEVKEQPKVVEEVKEQPKPENDPLDRPVFFSSSQLSGEDIRSLLGDMEQNQKTWQADEGLRLAATGSGIEFNAYGEKIADLRKSLNMGFGEAAEGSFATIAKRSAARTLNSFNAMLMQAQNDLQIAGTKGKLSDAQQTLLDQVNNSLGKIKAVHQASRNLNFLPENTHNLTKEDLGNFAQSVKLLGDALTAFEKKHPEGITKAENPAVNPNAISAKQVETLGLALKNAYSNWGKGTADQNAKLQQNAAKLVEKTLNILLDHLDGFTEITSSEKTLWEKYSGAVDSGTLLAKLLGPQKAKKQPEAETIEQPESEIVIDTSALQRQNDGDIVIQPDAPAKSIADEFNEALTQTREQLKERLTGTDVALDEKTGLDWAFGIAYNVRDRKRFTGALQRSKNDGHASISLKETQKDFTAFEPEARREMIEGYQKEVKRLHQEMLKTNSSFSKDSDEYKNLLKGLDAAEKGFQTALGMEDGAEQYQECKSSFAAISGCIQAYRESHKDKPALSARMQKRLKNMNRLEIVRMNFALGYRDPKANDKLELAEKLVSNALIEQCGNKATAKRAQQVLCSNEAFLKEVYQMRYGGSLEFICARKDNRIESDLRKNGQKLLKEYRKQFPQFPLPVDLHNQPEKQLVQDQIIV